MLIVCILLLLWTVKVTVLPGLSWPSRFGKHQRLATLSDDSLHGLREVDDSFEIDVALSPLYMNSRNNQDQSDLESSSASEQVKWKKMSPSLLSKGSSVKTTIAPFPNQYEMISLQADEEEEEEEIDL